MTTYMTPLTSSQYWDTDTASSPQYVDRSPLTIADIKAALAATLNVSTKAAVTVSAKTSAAPPVPPRDLALEGWVMIDEVDDLTDFVLMAPVPPPRE